MRAPVAEKLAELRKAIQRIEATPRKGFTKAQRATVSEMFNGCCAGCEEALEPGFHIDHVKELADGGDHALHNWQPLSAVTSARPAPGAKDRPRLTGSTSASTRAPSLRSFADRAASPTQPSAAR